MIFPRLVSLILLAVIVFQWLIMGNLARTGELVMLEGDSACYTYLQFKAGHVLQNRETGSLKLVYITPIVAVQSC